MSMNTRRMVCKRYDGNCTINPDFCARRVNRALAEPDRADLDLCRDCTKGRRYFMKIFKGKVQATRKVNLCIVEGCHSYARARGYCLPHYRMALREGIIKTKGQFINEVYAEVTA